MHGYIKKEIKSAEPKGMLTRPVRSELTIPVTGLIKKKLYEPITIEGSLEENNPLRMPERQLQIPTTLNVTPPIRVGMISRCSDGNISAEVAPEKSNIANAHPRSTALDTGSTMVHHPNRLGNQPRLVVTRIAPGNHWESPGPWARWLTTEQAIDVLKAAIEKLENAEAPLYVTDLFSEEGLSEENPLPDPPFNWSQL